MIDLKKILALGFLALALAASGCDDEKEKGNGKPDPDADVEPDADVQPDAEAPLTNACTNTDDATAIGPFGEEVMTYGDSEDKSISGLATDCAVSAALVMGLEGEEAREFVQSCVLQESDDAISSDCASCFALSAECAITNCFSPCSMAPVGASEDCIACRCENNCYQDYGTCSGREYGDQCDG